MKDDEKEFNDHEAQCSRCGKCCRVKMLWFDGSVKLAGYCEFYDEKKKECMCYDQRFMVCNHCLTVFDAMKQGGLPPTCEYVKHFPGYRSEIPDSEWEKK